MTLATGVFAYESSTDATYRTWGKGISDLLTAVGMTKTADTGQVDWATVTRPAGSYNGYEIRSVTWSSGETVVFKIEYGCETGTNYSPWLKIGYGSSSNGAGVLDSLSRNPGGITRFSGSSATVKTTYANVDLDKQCFVLQSDAGLFLMQKRLDRQTGLLSTDKDYSIVGGTWVTSGTTFGTSGTPPLLLSYRNDPYVQYLTGSQSIAFIPYNMTASPAGSTYIFRAYTAFPQISLLPSMCVYIKSEIPQDALFDVDLGFGVCTYRATGITYFGSASHGIGVLWSD